MRGLAPIIAAVIAAAISAPAAATDARTAFYSGLARQEMRLATVGYRLTTANVHWCPQTAPQTGWILSDLRRFEKGDRAAAAAAYGAGDGPFVAAAAPGSPAERARMAPGTPIFAISGEVVPTLGDEPTIRVDAIVVMLNALAPAAAVSITGAQGRTYRLAPSPGCASAFRIELARNDLGGAQAAANGTFVRMTLKLAQSIADDDELAAVVAHELAHNILRHRDRLGSYRSARRVRQTELEADRLSVWLMAGAGYDPGAAIRFWERHKRPLIRDAAHPPRSERIAAIEAEVTAMRAAHATDPSAGPAWVDAPPPLE